MQIILTILVLYLLYKLVFDFIVPVSKTASHVKRQFTNMNAMQEEMLRKQQQQNNTPKKTPQKQSGPAATTTTDSEYIDFEEIK